MMLYWEFVLPYIVVSKSIIVKRLKWVMMIQYCYMGMCPLMHSHVPYVYCSFKVKQVLLMSNCVKGLLIIHKYIYQFMLRFADIWSNPMSYNRYYVHFCVPWILGVHSNDLLAGTTNDCICCLYWLSMFMYVLTPYAGHDSHEVLWAAWPCHCICRWVLPLHHHPQ